MGSRARMGADERVRRGRLYDLGCPCRDEPDYPLGRLMPSGSRLSCPALVHQTDIRRAAGLDRSLGRHTIVGMEMSGCVVRRRRKSTHKLPETMGPPE